MRNLDKLLLLPLFAVLAISCSSPTSLQTSEYDDVYYTKKDKTIITDNAALAAESADQEAQAATEEGSVANPEYSEKSSGGTANNTDYYSPGYYDEDDYYYASRIRRFNSPYRGLSYYDFAYTDYYWYNRNPMYYGRSIYYDPFYSYGNPFYPCYTCYGYPPIYGGLTIVIGRPYYNRWGWGNPYYGGYNRYYGGGYGGYGGYYANDGWYRNGNESRNVQYGPRRERSAVPVGNNSNAPTRPRGDVGSGGPSGGGGIVRPDEGGLRNSRSTRGRSADSNDGIIQPEETRTGTRGRIDRSAEDAGGRTMEPADTNRPIRRRVDQLESAPIIREDRVDQPQRSIDPVPDSRTRERRQPSGDQPVYQPQRQEPSYQPRQRIEEQRSEPTYQPRQRMQEQRSEPTYQPRQRQESYEAPQRQERTYSAPSSSPSYNAPSRSSGGGGSYDGGSRSTRSRGN